MIFTVKAVVKRSPKNVEIVTNLAGCEDAADAAKKIATYYNVVKIVWVKPVEEKKK